jgi:hypothetical protein
MQATALPKLLTVRELSEYVRIRSTTVYRLPSKKMRVPSAPTAPLFRTKPINLSLQYFEQSSW